MHFVDPKVTTEFTFFLNFFFFNTTMVDLRSIVIAVYDIHCTAVFH